MECADTHCSLLHAFLIENCNAILHIHLTGRFFLHGIQGKKGNKLDSLIFQVLSNMRVLMTEDSNNAESSSFLLDDNSRYEMYHFTQLLDYPE